MYYKIHKSYRTVVAFCDTDLIGKKFFEGEKQLDLRENFYKDNEATEEQAIRVMQKQAIEDATFNIVGKQSINSAIKAGILSSKGVAYIDGIPFALIF